MKYNKRDLAIIIGDIIDHFDISLYSLLVPIIAPIFFPNHEPIMQLILGYSVMAGLIVTRPIGVFVFGIIAKNYGPQYALIISISGIAFTSIMIGILPSFEIFGYWAAILLIFFRTLQGVFAAGEPTISAIFILENKQENSSKIFSYLYQSGAIIGMLFASFAASLVTLTNKPEFFWRVPFLLGGVISLIGLYFRKKIFKENLKDIEYQKIKGNSQNIKHQKNDKINNIKLIWQDKIKIGNIAMAHLLMHATYAIPFIFMNSFIPKVTNITYAQMIWLNTILLAFDGIVIIAIGNLAKKFQAKKLMLFSSILIGIIIIPIFLIIPYANIWIITFIRFLIITIGAIYICQFNYWMFCQFNGNSKYLLIGIANSLSLIIGRNMTAICLYLWHLTGNINAPAIFIFFIALLSSIGVYFSPIPESENIKLNNLKESKN